MCKTHRQRHCKPGLGASAYTFTGSVKSLVGVRRILSPQRDVYEGTRSVRHLLEWISLCHCPARRAAGNRAIATSQPLNRCICGLTRLLLPRRRALLHSRHRRGRERQSKASSTLLRTISLRLSRRYGGLAASQRDGNARTDGMFRFDTSVGCRPPQSTRFELPCIVQCASTRGSQRKRLRTRTCRVAPCQRNKKVPEQRA